MADQDDLRALKDADGALLGFEAIAAFGVDLDSALDARSELENAAAYLELHIEQGPVLELMDVPLGAVLGTFGVERHRITWRGQAAHAGRRRWISAAMRSPAPPSSRSSWWRSPRRSATGR